MTQQINDVMRERRFALWKRGFLPHAKLHPIEKVEFPKQLKKEKSEE